jgi:hypothetical protein
MGDLRIGTATSAPAIGELKLGSTNISKIYSGTIQVWPASDTANVCGIEFTTINSVITAVTSGSSIQIVYSATDWNTNYNNATPTAAYYNYASSDTSGRGLFYNSYAAAVIQPPTGFRVPTITDINTLTGSPCSNNPNFNSLATAAGTGNWDSSTFTNTTYRGNSGLNLRGYGYIRNTDYSFIEDELAGTFWYIDSGSKGFKLGYVSSNPQSFMNSVQFIGSPIGKFGFQVRFCKDIP